MSDKFPSKIQIEEIRGSEWAKEATMALLVDRVGNSNQLLKKSNELLKALGGEKTSQIDLQKLERFDRAVTGTTGTVRDYGEATSDLRDKLKGVNKVFGTLGSGTVEISRAMTDLASASSSATGVMRTLGQAQTRMIGSMQRAGGGLGVVGGVMAAVTAGVSILVDRIMSSQRAFMSMTQAGLYFSGNSTQFAASVRRSGLELDQFTAIAEKYNVALLTSAGAESGYLRQVNALGTTFDRLNLTIKDGAEYFAEFLDQSRLSNAGYMQDEQAQREAFTKNAEIQQELARITGVSLKQQREQAQAAANSKLFQAMMMAVSPEEGERIRQVRGTLMTAGGLTLEQAEQSIVATRFNRPVSGALQQSYAYDPAQAERDRELIRSGGSVEAMRRYAEQQEAAGRSYRESGRSTQNVQLMMGTGVGATAAGVQAERMARSLQIDTTRAGAGGRGAAVPVDAATQAVNAIISAGQRAIGQADAAIIEGAGAALGTFHRELQKVADILNGINTEGTLARITSLLQGIKDVMDRIGGGVSTVSNAITSVTGMSGETQAAVAAGTVGAAGAAGVGYMGYRAIRNMVAPSATPPVNPAAVGARGLSRFIPGLAGVLEGYSEYQASGSILRGLAVGGGSIVGGMGGAAAGALTAPVTGPFGAIAGSVGGSLAGAEAARRMLGPGNAQAVTPTQGPAAPVPPASPPNFFNDVIMIVDQGFTRMGNGIDLLNTRWADDGPVMRRLADIATNTHDTQKILNERM